MNEDFLEKDLVEEKSCLKNTYYLHKYVHNHRLNNISQFVTKCCVKYCSVHVFAAAHVHVKLQLMWWISRVTVQKSSSFRTLHRTEEDRTSSREGARGRDRESKGIDLDPPWWSPYPPPHHHHPWCCRLWNCISTPKSSSFLGFARHSRPMQTKRKCILQNFLTSFIV